tara:strand:+ start:5949 stop:6578 length:630 start_codon:yes stop_codon:yes gene_type:complete
MATQTLKVPNKLSEITLGQYQQFSKISIDNVDEDFLEKKTIEIFCGVELKDVLKIKYTSIVRVIGVINKMFNQKTIFKDRFKINNVEYGFIPKLDDMTYGEFVDLDTLMSDWQTMDQAMAVLFRKVKDTHKDKYTIEEYNSFEMTDMKKMPLDVAFGAIFFLQSLGKELVNHSLSYLGKKSKTMTKQQKQTLMKTLDGGQLSIPLAKAI